MSARVTKLFLQDRVHDAKSKPQSKTTKATAAQSNAKNPGKKKKNGVACGAKVKATKKKATMRFLEQAQQERQAADKTRENLRKLKTKASDKTQRLMAKILSQRKLLV
ncbi:TPA: hypothetical protein N0F65_006312 [Lagenidium giganteum]|uniref:Uncharacterized protein n=1 Tax=Lagenidium giganteum TaxID=4803 RepID=A0AAV2YK94_9STRA|nr:TPA: hypothetical protein N0F65_006312 [Lagenidium giganteum]